MARRAGERGGGRRSGLGRVVFAAMSVKQTFPRRCFLKKRERRTKGDEKRERERETPGIANPPGTRSPVPPSTLSYWVALSSDPPRNSFVHATYDPGRPGLGGIPAAGPGVGGRPRAAAVGLRRSLRHAEDTESLLRREKSRYETFTEKVTNATKRRKTSRILWLMRVEKCFIPTQNQIMAVGVCVKKSLWCSAVAFEHQHVPVGPRTGSSADSGADR